jgi:hypothetical protein
MARLHCHTRNRWTRNEARRRRVVGLVTAAATLLAAMITVSGLALADSLPRGTGCSIDANGMAGPAAAIGDGGHATAPGGSGGDGGSGGSGGAGGKGGSGGKGGAGGNGGNGGAAGPDGQPGQGGEGGAGGAPGSEGGTPGQPGQHGEPGRAGSPG